MGTTKVNHKTIGCQLLRTNHFFHADWQIPGQPKTQVLTKAKENFMQRHKAFCSSVLTEKRKSQDRK